MTDRMRDTEAGNSAEAVEGTAARVVIDGSYLRSQARDAILTFIAPLQGVYAAATGQKFANPADDSAERKKEI